MAAYRACIQIRRFIGKLESVFLTTKYFNLHCKCSLYELIHIVLLNPDQGSYVYAFSFILST